MTMRVRIGSWQVLLYINIPKDSFIIYKNNSITLLCYKWYQLELSEVQTKMVQIIFNQ